MSFLDLQTSSLVTLRLANRLENAASLPQDYVRLTRLPALGIPSCHIRSTRPTPRMAGTSCAGRFLPLFTPNNVTQGLAKFYERVEKWDEYTEVLNTQLSLYVKM